MHVHLCPNGKFLDSLIFFIGKHGKLEENLFLLKGEGQVKPDGEKTIIAPIGSKKLQEIVSRLGSSDTFYVHFMDYKTINWLSKTQINCTMGWVFWGAVFYKVLELENPDYFLLEPKTRNIVLKNKGRGFLWETRIVSLMLKVYTRFRHKKMRDKLTKILDRTKYLLHFNEFDFQLLQQVFPDSKIQFLPFQYGNFAKIAGKLEGKYIKSPRNKHLKILVGNSGSPTNNHIDTWDKLTQAKLRDNYEVHVPLTYGKAFYIKTILADGSSKFGNRFFPLRSHMKLEDYFSYLGQMDACLVGHNRAEGLGNIIPLLFLGKKVYLNPDTSTYKMFKNRGILVFNINDLSNIDVSLTLEEQKKNRELTTKCFGPAKLKGYYQKNFS